MLGKVLEDIIIDFFKTKYGIYYNTSKKKKKTKDTSAFIPPVLQNRTHFFLSPVCLWSLGEHVTSRFKNEVERMGFDMNNAWRISNINEKYK